MHRVTLALSGLQMSGRGLNDAREMLAKRQEQLQERNIKLLADVR